MSGIPIGKKLHLFSNELDSSVFGRKKLLIHSYAKQLDSKIIVPASTAMAMQYNLSDVFTLLGVDGLIAFTRNAPGEWNVPGQLLPNFLFDPTPFDPIESISGSRSGRGLFGRLFSKRPRETATQRRISSAASDFSVLTNNKLNSNLDVETVIEGVVITDSFTASTNSNNFEAAPAKAVPTRSEFDVLADSPFSYLVILKQITLSEILNSLEANRFKFGYILVSILTVSRSLMWSKASLEQAAAELKIEMEQRAPMKERTYSVNRSGVPSTTI